MLTDENPGLAAALVAAQAEMPAVTPDATNPHFRSQFVTLGKLISKVRPVLNKHGIAVIQMPSQDREGRPVLITRLLHESGQVMESTMPLLLAKQDPQGLGSALTYAKRYALAAAVGISDQEDDDGNAGSKVEEKAKPESNGGLPPADVAALMSTILEKKKAGMNFSDLSTLLGSVGIDAPPKNSVKSIEETVAHLDGARALNLAKALEGWSA